MHQVVAQEIDTDRTYTEELLVVGRTPVEGLGLSKERLPYAVQTADSEMIETKISLDLSDFLNQSLAGIHINHAQNNPLQPDLQYRGFTASPLLGNSQGLAVYVDGVRINEPFGDAVNWDIISQSAISHVNLFGGSNPMFGLNALGGALSVTTKSGITHPGYSAKFLTGSFGRRSVVFEAGDRRENIDFFVTASGFEEDGWRDHSGSELEQIFVNLGWRNAATGFTTTLSTASSDLNGNGPAPAELLSDRRSAVFTYPDNTQNELAMVTISANHEFSNQTKASVVFYSRTSDRLTFNADGSDFDVIVTVDTFGNGLNENGDIIIATEACSGKCVAKALVEDGELIEDQNGNTINSDKGQDELAINNYSDTEQDGYGLSAQISKQSELLGHSNNLIAGVSYDYAASNYQFSTELAEFSQDRGTAGSGFFHASSLVAARVKTSTSSVFVMDSFSLTDALTVLVSARYNDVRIDLSGSHGDESVLPPGESGRHTFSRLNPAIGLTHIAGSGLTSYFSYSESSRVPTPAELTCHDETNPCALPNSFLADPPLDQVVAKTWEAGFRGANYDISWRLALYRTVNHDDIYFLLTQEGPGLSPGFFSSIGETQRSGVELSLQADYESWRWSFHYSRINAKFKDGFELRSENNPFSLENDLEVLEVTNGSHLPGIPDHLARLGIDWLPTSRHLIGIDAIYNSGSYFRGDEANVSGRISGYTIINLRGRYRVNDHLEIFIKVENLLDQQFESFGLYGDPGEAPGLDNLADTRFLSPGAPRGAWIGLRFDI